MPPLIPRSPEVAADLAAYAERLKELLHRCAVHQPTDPATFLWNAQRALEVICRMRILASASNEPHVGVGEPLGLGTLLKRPEIRTIDPQIRNRLESVRSQTQLGVHVRRPEPEDLGVAVADVANFLPGLVDWLYQDPALAGIPRPEVALLDSIRKGGHRPQPVVVDVDLDIELARREDELARMREERDGAWEEAAKLRNEVYQMKVEIEQMGRAAVRSPRAYTSTQGPQVRLRSRGSGGGSAPLRVAAGVLLVLLAAGLGVAAAVFTDRVMREDDAPVDDAETNAEDEVPTDVEPQAADGDEADPEDAGSASADAEDGAEDGAEDAEGAEGADEPSAEPEPPEEASRATAPTRQAPTSACPEGMARVAEVRALALGQPFPARRTWPTPEGALATKLVPAFCIDLAPRKRKEYLSMPRMPSLANCPLNDPTNELLTCLTRDEAERACATMVAAGRLPSLLEWEAAERSAVALGIELPKHEWSGERFPSATLRLPAAGWTRGDAMWVGLLRAPIRGEGALHLSWNQQDPSVRNPERGLRCAVSPG